VFNERQRRCNDSKSHKASLAKDVRGKTTRPLGVRRSTTGFDPQAVSSERWKALASPSIHQRELAPRGMARPGRALLGARDRKGLTTHLSARNVREALDGRPLQGYEARKKL